ncbi:MAG TPA: vanadium-dependent haloperoxidase, partial [Gemmataceae bacterium]|nr:vanadium-dependent haloperoxidase [Gemmataceae bacterium]
MPIRFRPLLRSTLPAIALAAVGCDQGGVDPELSSSYDTLSQPSGETIARWNKNAIAILLPSVPPTGFTRGEAMVHIAMHDAANAVRPRYQAYAYTTDQDTGADPALAAAAAAHDVLKAIVPAKAAQLDSMLAVDLDSVKQESLREHSLAVGAAAANAIVALRSTDGSTAVQPYSNTPGPGNYQGAFITPQWGAVTPFVLDSGGQFVGDGPPDLSSAQWAADYNEVKSLGALNSTTRTAEQTAEAKFWLENPPTVYNRVLQRTVISQGLDLWESAHVFALVQIAFADAAISSWHAKFAYDFWRPIT